MNQEMNPMGQPEKKGMSKGCLVGLIVGLVLVVIVVGIGLISWMKCDELKKAGVITFVDQVRITLNNDPPEGVDTVLVNSVVEAFTVRLKADTIAFEQVGLVVQPIQSILEDKTVDAEEAESFVRLLIDFYPELGELAPPEETMEDTSAVADSLEQTD